MTLLTEAIAWYEHHAAEVVGLYKALPPDHLHRQLGDLLPTAPALVLDVGAETGRDAAWFAGLGYDVVAAEPAGAVHAVAIRLQKPGVELSGRLRSPPAELERDTPVYLPHGP